MNPAWYIQSASNNRFNELTFGWVALQPCSLGRAVKEHELIDWLTELIDDFEKQQHRITVLQT